MCLQLAKESGESLNLVIRLQNGIRLFIFVEKYKISTKNKRNSFDIKIDWCKIIDLLNSEGKDGPII